MTGTGLHRCALSLDVAPPLPASRPCKDCLFCSDCAYLSYVPVIHMCAVATRGEGRDSGGAPDANAEQETMHMPQSR